MRKQKVTPSGLRRLPSLSPGRWGFQATKFVSSHAAHSCMTLAKWPFQTLLRKPGALTEAETEIMREHCFRGYQMLKKIPFLSEASEIVYSHQERFDGTGYPRGLSGQSIPLGARIFSIADTLDAITSDRPYRAAQSIQVAREE